MKKTTGGLVLRGKVYHARWKIGKQSFMQTTGHTDKKKALVKMREIVAPFAGVGEVEALERVAARLEGRKAEVEQFELEANPPPKIGTVEDGIFRSPAWMAFCASTKRPDSGDSTMRQYESEFKRFVAWLLKRRPHVEFLHEVTERDAEDYARHLIDSKVSASTFNQHRNLLVLLWRVLEDRARLTANPWKKIGRRKLTPLANRKQALTPAQFDALLAATAGDRDLHDLFITLAWTGQRLVDGVMLKWGAVDFGRGVITLAPQKTARRQGKVLHIPMFPAVRDVLNRREGGQPVNTGDLVFPLLAEEYTRDASGLVKRIGAVFERAGMKTTEAREDRRRGVTLYGAHSLRHLAVTAFTSAGLPSAMVKAITGHSTDAMLEHYQHIGADMASEIAARMTARTLPDAAANEPQGVAGTLTRPALPQTAPDAAHATREGNGERFEAFRAIVDAMTQAELKQAQAYIQQQTQNSITPP